MTDYLPGDEEHRPWRRHGAPGDGHDDRRKYSRTTPTPDEVWDYARAGGMMPQEQDHAGPRSFYEFLQTLQKRASMTRALPTRQSTPKSWL